MNVLHKARPRRNGHDASQHPSTADLESCPYCGQEIGGDRERLLKIRKRIETEERTRLARLQTALKQQFSGEQQRAQAKVKGEIARAVKEATTVADAKMKALIANQ